MIILSETDFKELHPATQADVAALIARKFRVSSAPSLGDMGDGLDYGGVVDLTLGQVEHLVKGVNQRTRDGLKAMVKAGRVCSFSDLRGAGITEYGRFQAGLTKRVRTVTGLQGAFLFAWDEWEYDEGGSVISGRYGFTPATYASFSAYFSQ